VLPVALALAVIGAGCSGGGKSKVASAHVGGAISGNSVLAATSTTAALAAGLSVVAGDVLKQSDLPAGWQAAARAD
jgi:hypothetical protein